MVDAARSPTPGRELALRGATGERRRAGRLGAVLPSRSARPTPGRCAACVRAEAARTRQIAQSDARDRGIDHLATSAACPAVPAAAPGIVCSRQMRAAAILLLALVLATAAAAARSVGTPGDDRLVGTAKADMILGLAGRDRIAGGPGADFVHPGPGRDTVDTGPATTASRPSTTAHATSFAAARGADLVNADLADSVARDCELVGRRPLARPVHEPGEPARDAGRARQLHGRPPDRRDVPGRAPLRRRGDEHRLLHLARRRQHVAQRAAPGADHGEPARGSAHARERPGRRV